MKNMIGVLRIPFDPRRDEELSVDPLTLNQRVQGSKSLCAHQKHKYLSSLFDGAPDAVFALFGCPHSVHESEWP